MSSKDMSSKDMDSKDDSCGESAAPAGLFSKKNPKHAAIKNLRMTIRNFLEPYAAETLNQLVNYTAEDFYEGFSTRCQCGCYNRMTVMDAFDNADLDSLKYIVEHKLLHPAMLCTILSKIFRCAGTLDYPHRVAYEMKIAGKDFDKENIGLYRGWINLVDANIEYLLTYLCSNHAELVKVWRKTCPMSKTATKDTVYAYVRHETPTLLHCAFYGHTSDETKKSWVTKLIDIGCDPFALYNYKAGCYDTPFKYMLNNLYYDMAMQTSLEKTPDELRTLVNYIDDFDIKYDRENILMRILVCYRHTKKPHRVLELLAVIDLVFKLGIDVTHLDKYNRNITDYIDQYGYTDLLKERLIQYNLPAATKNVKPKCSKNQNHNVSPFAALMHKYRMAKSPEELYAFKTEYDRLVAKYGSITEKQLNDTGHNHEYASLVSLMHIWGFNQILSTKS